jgi:hypothetical protein
MNPWEVQNVNEDPTMRTLREIERESQQWGVPPVSEPQRQGPPPGWVQLPDGRWFNQGAQPQQMPQQPVQQQRQVSPPGWVQAPNGQWVQQSPVVAYPSQAHMNNQGFGQVQAPPNQQWGPQPAQYHDPRVQPSNQMYGDPRVQQPVAQRPVQQPIQQRPALPTGVPPKDGATPAVKKKRVAFYVAMTATIISALSAVAAALYFVLNY